MADVPSLWGRHLAGLSNLANGGKMQPRLVLRGFVFGIPVAVSAVAYWRYWDAKGIAPELLSAFAMMAGVLLGVFALMANWRVRLDQRAADRPASEAEARRYVSAAVAHSVIAVEASLAASLTAILVIVAAPGARFWSALTFGIATYLGLLVLLVVNAAFVSYEMNVDAAVDRADRERTEAE